MDNSRECRLCKTSKSNSDFYGQRKVCKQCFSKRVLDKRKEKQSLDKEITAIDVINSVKELKEYMNSLTKQLEKLEMTVISSN